MPTSHARLPTRLRLDSNSRLAVGVNCFVQSDASPTYPRWSCWLLQRCAVSQVTTTTSLPPHWFEVSNTSAPHTQQAHQARPERIYQHVALLAIHTVKKAVQLTCNVLAHSLKRHAPGTIVVGHSHVVHTDDDTRQ